MSNETLKEKSGSKIGSKHGSKNGAKKSSLVRKKNSFDSSIQAKSQLEQGYVTFKEGNDEDGSDDDRSGNDND